MRTATGRSSRSPVCHLHEMMAFDHITYVIVNTFKCLTNLRYWNNRNWSGSAFSAVVKCCYKTHTKINVLLLDNSYESPKKCRLSVTNETSYSQT